jgi:MoaA/NifB/PqqE/SkfB family radical SAM enzyme
MRSTHDYVCDRNGVFDKAIAMIKEGKRLGYHVTTNTTVFKETRMEEVEELCALVADLGVDGMLIAPGYHYESVDLDIFPVRQEIHRKFRQVLDLSKRYRLSSTPMYLEFAAGLRTYNCSPWSTVTFTPRGWKALATSSANSISKPGRNSGAGLTGTIGNLARTAFARIASCTAASRPRQSWSSGKPRDMLRMATWNLLG